MVSMVSQDRAFFHDPEMRVECYDDGEGGVILVTPIEIVITPAQAEKLAQALVACALSARDNSPHF